LKNSPAQKNSLPWVTFLKLAAHFFWKRSGPPEKKKRWEKMLKIIRILNFSLTRGGPAPFLAIWGPSPDPLSKTPLPHHSTSASPREVKIVWPGRPPHPLPLKSRPYPDPAVGLGGETESMGFPPRKSSKAPWAYLVGRRETKVQNAGKNTPDAPFFSR